MEQKAPHSPPGGARKRRPSYAASSRARPLLRKRSSAVEISTAPSSARSAPSRESVVVDSADTGANKKPRPPLGAYNLFFRHERNNIMNGTTSSLTSSVLSGKGCSSEQLLREIMSDDGSATGMTSATFANPSSGGGAGGAKCHAELTKIVSSRWRVLDAPSRAIYDGLALLERKKYERAMERWAKVEERRRRQREEEFLSSSSQSCESAGEENNDSGSDDDDDDDEEDEDDKHSERQFQGNDDRAEKWRRAIARLPTPSTKSATDAASYMRCKSIIEKGTAPSPNIRPQTLISEPPGKALHTGNTPSSSSSISALRTSILERKRQLQRAAEREYHRLARAEKASSSSRKSTSRALNANKASSFRKLTSRASKGRDRLSPPANTKTASSGKTLLLPGKESAFDEAADNDWTEQDAAMILLEAIPSDAEDGGEDAGGVVDDIRRRSDDDDDTLRLLTEAFAAEDNDEDDEQRSGSSATVSAAAGCRKEEKGEEDDDNDDDESRMHARLYDPIPVAAGAAAHTRGNNLTAATAAAAAAASMSSAGSRRAHSNGMHDDSAVPSSSSLLLHHSSSAISNLTGTGTDGAAAAAAALTSRSELFVRAANDTAAARSAPGSSSRANDEDELDGESVRFLASIFGARSA